MRGEQFLSRNTRNRAGITPAYAGRTVIQSLSVGPQQDHPRVCGENRRLLAPCRGCRGSPPRMRGELVISSPQVGEGRITPAYAGRTGPGTRRVRSRWDHPRVCGENASVVSTRIPLSGSPPRMRGERRDHQASCRRRRITPAYAGRTCPMHRPAIGRPDHPRVCGENNVAQPGDVAPILRTRITPAYAGRTPR